MSWLKIGSVLMLLGVILGAFGAHGLKRSLSPESLTVYQTGVFYHLIHALAIVVVSAVFVSHPSKANVVNGSFLLGIILFSGSLYALAVTGVKMWGAVTPFGGVLFLAGWALLAIKS